ncbi:MAG: hypothetical protein DWQ49_12585 [Bacteroidetes bacterium]|nr:MAG: hypothetical protein DWQ49_12585 [Bacteroidota bacterium]
MSNPDLEHFIEQQVAGPPHCEGEAPVPEYNYIDDAENQNRLNRVFDYLFDEVMRRRKDGTSKK